MERNRMTNKNDVPEYEPFGGEWEREISKLTKKELIGFIRNVCKQKQEAESRLKTWLAVREEELYYARQDAVKSIRIVWDKYPLIHHVSVPSIADYVWIEIIDAIKLTIEQAEKQT